MTPSGQLGQGDRNDTKQLEVRNYRDMFAK